MSHCAIFALTYSDAGLCNQSPGGTQLDGGARFFGDMPHEVRESLPRVSLITRFRGGEWPEAGSRTHTHRGAKLTARSLLVETCLHASASPLLLQGGGRYEIVGSEIGSPSHVQQNWSLSLSLALSLMCLHPLIALTDAALPLSLVSTQEPSNLLAAKHVISSQKR